MRDEIYRLIDAHDYRRRRPRSMLPGCSLIWVYLNREMRREGKDTAKNTLSLAVAGWKLVDRIQFLSKLPEGWRERNREVSAALFRRLQSDTRGAQKKALELGVESKPTPPAERQLDSGHAGPSDLLEWLKSQPKGSRITKVSFPK